MRAHAHDSASARLAATRARRQSRTLSVFFLTIFPVSGSKTRRAWSAMSRDDSCTEQNAAGGLFGYVLRDSAQPGSRHLVIRGVESSFVAIRWSSWRVVTGRLSRWP